MNTLVRAWRRLSQAPGFTIAAVITITVSLAVLGALASFWNSLVIEGQPGIGASERVFRLQPAWSRREIPYPSWQHYRALTELAPRTLDIAFYSPRIRPVKIGDHAPQTAGVHAVSPEYFRVLQASLVAGAGLADSTSLRPAVVSWRLWKEQFQSHPRLLGTPLTIGADTAYVVAGIAAPDFLGPEGLQQIDVWVRLDEATSWGSGRLIARSKSRADIETVRQESEAELAVLWKQVVERPNGTRDRWRNSSIHVEPLGGGLHAENRRGVGVMIAGVGGISVLILLIATANLAALVLTRALARERDYAVRFALGARAREVVREPVSEVLLLFALSGLMAFLLARPVGAVLVRSLSTPFPFFVRVHWDLATMGALAGLALSAALLCAIGPAIRVARADAASALRADGGGARVGLGARRLQAVFLAAQLLIGFLLVGASATIALRVSRVFLTDVGVRNPADVLVVQTPSAGESAERNLRFADSYSMLVGNAVGAPAATGFVAPGDNRLLRATAKPLDGDRPPQPVRVNIVSPSFFDVVGVPVIQGRGFHGDDRSGAAPVVALSRSAASLLFPGDAAVGARLRIGEAGLAMTTIGVVADVTYDRLDTREPVLYVIADQFDPVLGRAHLFMRTSAAESAARRVDSIARHVAPFAAVRQSRTLAAMLDASTRGERSLFVLVLVCAGLALVMAVTGVFGLVTYTVQQRRREIAVRMALGSTSLAILRLYSWGSLRLALIALLPGVAVAGGAYAVLAQALGPLADQFVNAMILAGAVLIGATAAASALAVHMAATLSPAALLRSE